MNIPFGLDLDKDHFQKKSNNQTVVSTVSVSNERLSVSSEAEALETTLDQSFSVNSMNSIHRINLPIEVFF